MTVRELFVTLGFQVDQSGLSQAKSAISGFKNFAGKALGALGIGLSAVALKKFASECVNLASTAEQIQNKFDVVFKGMNEEANQWAEEYAETVGRSVTTIKGYMADSQNLLVGFMGDDRRAEAMQMSEQMTELALDIASFSNMNEDEAVARMTKAVMGESEAAKSLGAVLNDVTRAEAMERLQIQGKYDDLDMATRMQVNYNAILSQSADAVGDCVRSMDSYESRQRQLNSSIRYFKEYIGSQLLPTAARVLKFGNDIVKKATDWAKKIVALNNKLKISKTIGEGFDRIFRSLGSVFSWAGSLVDIFVNSVGGAENALRILAAVAGGLLAAFHPVLAVIALVTLVIDDFVTFMEGGFSVTGGIFEKFGISASDARLKIQGAFNAIKKAVEGTVKFIGQLASGDFAGAMATLKTGWSTAWGSISEAGSGAIDKIKGFISNTKWSEVGKNAGKSVSNGIKAGISFLSGIGERVKGFITKVDWSQLGTDLSSKFKSAVETGIDLLKGIGNTVKGFFSEVDWATLGTETINLFTGAFDLGAQALSGIGETIKAFITGVGWGGIGTSIINRIKSGIDVAKGRLKSLITGIFDGSKIKFPDIVNDAIAWGKKVVSNIKSGITKAPSAIKDAIVTLWDEVVTWFNSLPEQLIEWGSNIVSNIIQGITNAPLSIADALHKAIFGGGEEEPVTPAPEPTSTPAPTPAPKPSEMPVEMKPTVTTDTGEVKEASAELINAATSYYAAHYFELEKSGKDFDDVLAAGMKSGVDTVNASATEIAQAISDYLHFSVPSKGPLSDAESYMPDFMNLLSEGIASNAPTVVSAVETMAQQMSDALKKAFQEMASNAQTGMAQVQSAVQAGMSAVLSTMQALAAQAYVNGVHFVQNLVNGINAGLPALRAAASEVAAIMSEQVKHSVPKKGPMKDDDQWMRHYMQNLANGIKQNKGLVTDQMSTLAQDLASLGQPASSRAAASAGGFSRRMMSVNQNVTISNSYNGTAGGADKAIRNTMKKSAYDASTYMAKAIGYARG